ncbi:MAG: serine esterase [Verrucomicrobiales bacterium]|nr:serine esterase [Verrucomicrobiales bacterium]
MLHSEFVPAPKSDSTRLMIVMHGLGDSAASYRIIPQMLGDPAMNYLLVNAPDHYFGGYSWFEFQGAERPGIERSVGLLTDLLDEQREAGYPSEETYVMGFSQGGLLTLEIGCTYPHRLAGCIDISGWIQDLDGLIGRFSPVVKEQRFLVTHGTMDPVLPFDRSRQQIERLKRDGLDVSWHEFDKVHTIHPGEFELFKQFIQPNS